jgi:Tol biopolymer transport system component
MRPWLFALVLCACRVPDVDLSGRMCPCIDSYVCDPATQTCVRELPDGAADAPLGPFSLPQPISELNGAGSSEDDPTATGDLLEIYFDSDRAAPGAAMGDIWVAKRASTSDPWGTPQLVIELASLADDTSPDISPDGLTMYFSSDRAKAGDRDLYVTTRPSRTAAWSPPVRIAELATSSEEGSAMETADRKHLVFQSGRSGSSDLYVATRNALSDAWSNVAPIPGLSNPAFSENQHFINADATMIYYVSNETGTEHIYSATCAGPSGPCVNQQMMAVINSPTAADVDPWLSPDGHTLLFSSSRSGNGDLYISTR